MELLTRLSVPARVIFLLTAAVLAGLAVLLFAISLNENDAQGPVLPALLGGAIVIAYLVIAETDGFVRSKLRDRRVRDRSQALGSGPQMADATRQYRDPTARPHQEAELIFGSGTEEAICDALAGAALYDDDESWIESWCVALAASDSATVRGLAATCLGHVARRFGTIQPDSRELLLRLQTDPDVAGQADDALEDVARFVDRT